MYKQQRALLPASLPPGKHAGIGLLSRPKMGFFAPQG